MATQPAKVKEVEEVVQAPIDESRIFELICQRAYELYLQRGCTHGRDIEDRLQAEVEVRERIARKGRRSSS